MRICLVSWELAPFESGGIGVYIASLARLLDEQGLEVTVVCRERHRSAADVPSGIRWVWSRDPTPVDVAAFGGERHAWSGLVYEALREAYGSDGPDLIEFPDFHGSAFVALQARRAGDPVLRDTRIVVRAHSTWEIVQRLNGHLGTDTEAETVVALERHCLAHADRLLVAGGDIGGTYRRLYGDAIAPVEMIRHPLTLPRESGGDEHYRADRPLRFLYLGRAERRKGPDRLLEAALADPSGAWTVSYLGGDTASGVLGASMKGQLELMAAGDPRVRFLEPVPREQVPEVVRAHDVVVMPSRWECWPYAVLEATALGRPVLGTPTGGLTELVRPGESGWLTDDTSAKAIERVLGRLIAEPALVTELVRSGGPRRHAEALTDPDEIADRYRELAALPVPRRLPAPRRRRSLVSVIIPYHRLDGFVADAVRSIAGQTYPRLEVIVVDDGSLGPRDQVIDALDAGPHPVRVVTRTNGGLGAARNLGIAVSRGRYVFSLDADNVVEPTFVEKAVAVLERDPRVAYVTAWSRFIGPDGEPVADEGAGYCPLGNEVPLADRVNVAGDAAAMLPRRIFDLGYAYSEEVAISEDWMLYRALRRDGRYGVVLPERLIRYRLRDGSMYQETGAAVRDRVHEEMNTQLEAIAWTAT